LPRRNQRQGFNVVVGQELGRVIHKARVGLAIKPSRRWAIADSAFEMRKSRQDTDTRRNLLRQAGRDDRRADVRREEPGEE